MSKVAQIHAIGWAAPAGKSGIAASMYLKGQSFVGAALLLRQADASEPSTYVSLHLMCQGVELMLKGALLLKDFAKYWPLLKKGFGHNLAKLVEETGKAYGQDALRGAVFKAELQQLAQYYGDHALRYAGLHDILIAPQAIQRVAFMRRVTAFMVLAERGLKASGIRTADRVF